jgi:hypothetical protein
MYHAIKHTHTKKKRKKRNKPIPNTLTVGIEGNNTHNKPPPFFLCMLIFLLFVFTVLLRFFIFIFGGGGPLPLVWHVAQNKCSPFSIPSSHGMDVETVHCICKVVNKVKREAWGRKREREREREKLNTFFPAAIGIDRLIDSLMD